MSASVLVVDDDARFRAVVARMLTTRGLTVVGEAESVASALAAAHDLRPSSALVDVGLPDGDGITLASELTRLSWRPLVVLTSTDADAVTPEIVRRCGARAFVPKNDLPNAPLKCLLTAD